MDVPLLAGTGGFFSNQIYGYLIKYLPNGDSLWVSRFYHPHPKGLTFSKYVLKINLIKLFEFGLHQIGTNIKNLTLDFILLFINWFN